MIRAENHLNNKRLRLIKRIVTGNLTGLGVFAVDVNRKCCIARKCSSGLTLRRMIKMLSGYASLLIQPAALCTGRGLGSPAERANTGSGVLQIRGALTLGALWFSADQPEAWRLALPRRACACAQDGGGVDLKLRPEVGRKRAGVVVVKIPRHAGHRLL